MDLTLDGEVEQLDVEPLRPFEVGDALSEVVERDAHAADPRTRARDRENGSVRITFVGHAGLFIETRHGSVLCDPWFTPAYFGSWFPFPRNDTLDRTPLLTPDFLYVSHLHRDHFDPAFLAA